MDKVVDANLVRLAVLEEKHTNTLAFVARVNDRVEAHDLRLKVIEEANVRLTAIAATLSMTVKAFWAVCGVGVIACMYEVFQLVAEHSTLVTR
jgi:hypothetical protein